jgi:hypothetical protein
MRLGVTAIRKFRRASIPFEMVSHAIQRPELMDVSKESSVLDFAAWCREPSFAYNCTRPAHGRARRSPVQLYHEAWDQPGNGEGHHQELQGYRSGQRRDWCRI